MKYFVAFLLVAVALGVASAGYIGGGWAPSYSVYSRPVVYSSPSYGWNKGYGGYGGYGGLYSGYGGWNRGYGGSYGGWNRGYGGGYGGWW